MSAFPPLAEATAAVRAYHDQSKHRFEAYAPGPASLDWEAQPDPFRRFEGCSRFELPLTGHRSALPFSALAHPGRIPPRPLDLAGLGLLFELSLAISAWKTLGPARWAVRCNPSSGNLHPLEAYPILPGLGAADDPRPAGVYHYEAEDHALELRCTFPTEHAARIAERLPPDCLVLGLSLIPWREAWKYGVRAWRYCQLDLGHAIGALHYAAACNGWQVRRLTAWRSDQMARLLGLDRPADFEQDEPEYPAALLVIGPNPPESLTSEDLLAAADDGEWRGTANRLDPRHLYRWDAVDAMARRCAAHPPGSARPGAAPLPPRQAAPADPAAAEVLRTRRSARAFDPRRSLDAALCYRLLDGCLSRPGVPPWDPDQGRSPLHLLLFVHRVDGLASGLYLLLGDPDAERELRPRLRGEFVWQRPEGCPDHLACYLLVAANTRGAALRFGCHQPICADSAFAVAMLGEYDAALGETPGGYDRLLQEAGRLGQALYIESHREGVGASGIGCFFDDPIHDMLGLRDEWLQTLYMFTVGPAKPEHGVADQPAYPRQAEPLR